MDQVGLSTTQVEYEVEVFDSAAELVREPLRIPNGRANGRAGCLGFRSPKKFEGLVNLQDSGLAAMTSETPNVSYIFVASKGGQVAMYSAILVLLKLR